MDINISFIFLMNMVDKFRILIVLFVLILGQSAASAAVYKLEGMVGGKLLLLSWRNMKTVSFPVDMPINRLSGRTVMLNVLGYR